MFESVVYCLSQEEIEYGDQEEDRENTGACLFPEGAVNGTLSQRSTKRDAIWTITDNDMWELFKG